MLHELTNMGVLLATGCVLGFAVAWLVFRRQILVDDLTGLANQRAISWILRRRLQRALSRRSPLCVALLDIDDFKSVNTRFGYTAADDLLRGFSEKVRCSCVGSGVDFLRYRHGDEFLLVLNDMDYRSSEQFFRNLTHSVEETPFLVEEHAHWLSFSVGIGSAGHGVLVDPAEQIKRLLKTCEMGLAENKRKRHQQPLSPVPGAVMPRRPLYQSVASWCPRPRPERTSIPASRTRIRG
jgi:diguanylate cyclase (GGDEF)-like protein